MKTLKITLIALLSIGLLTAVLPSLETNPVIENTNHEINEVNVIQTVFTEREKGASVPTNG
ncbi:hypothetical protein [uncultured Lacinutrix sp.]|uniref:hypothetical protein n=1 Tax=uncultured Lacinutrix sp. TaxID=574032 RepID=UPI0026335E87|nr:hypothetical protein [uncultured Lacinutrix sp.]